MISWPIKAALGSGIFESVIVSTDSEEIASISIKYGATVPFERPKELSDDFTIAPKVIKHALEWLIENKEPPDFICTIYPTSPLLEAEDLREACKLFLQSKADITFSGAEFPFPIQRAIKLNDEGRVSMFSPEHYLTRSQDLEKAYQDAGQFYFSTTRAILEEWPVFSEIASLYVMPRHKVVDIDTPEDWELAEKLFEVNKSSG